MNDAIILKFIKYPIYSRLIHSPKSETRELALIAVLEFENSARIL